MTDKIQHLNLVTDKTNISNTQFLCAIFGEDVSGALPAQVGFKGNPSNVHGSKWHPAGWGTKCILSEASNNYFTAATIKPDESGHYKRKAQNFDALHCVVLDDIGTKVKADINLRPSWELETSSGNYQYGYILKEPVTCADEANELIKVIIDHGLCDKGANTPVNRLYRLPVGINGKHAPAFECKLTEWSPDLKYTPNEILEGLGIDRQKGRDVQADIYQCDVLIDKLKEEGLYKAALGSGKHDITCPWVEEHTDFVDRGTAYFEPSLKYPNGGFKCLHSHGDSLSLRNLKDVLGVKPDEEVKTKIVLSRGTLHKQVEGIEELLARTGQYYCSGGVIVKLVKDTVTGQTVLKPVPNSHALAPELSALADFEKWDARAKDYLKADPPERLVSSLLNAMEYKQLLPVNAIAAQPYLDMTGNLVTEPGYNLKAKVYGDFEGYDALPERPSKDDAVKSLEALKGLLAEFPFTSESARASAVSAIFTAVLRPGLNLAPMYHVHAPQPGSGKSYLCKIVGAFVSKGHVAPLSFPQNEEECGKVLIAELVTGPAVIEFDNMTYDIIPYKSLCTVLTSESFSGRVLGVSKMVITSTRALFLSSGNNVMPIRDMARRCVTIHLDPECEQPMARQYKQPDLWGYLRSNRKIYLAHVYTILMAWKTAGEPKTECPNVATYDMWSKYCRQPLLWLGMPDPAEAMFSAVSEDPEYDALRAFLSAWYGKFESEPKMVRDILPLIEGDFEQKCEHLVAIKEVFEDVAYIRGVYDRKRIGHWLKRNQGKLANNYKLVKADGKRAASVWKVVRVK